MQLPNPNDGKAYERVIKDAQGDPQWGIRNEHKPDEEIVFIPSGMSNQQYWQPEVVFNPEGCTHDFAIINIRKREIQCRKCEYAVIFHPTNVIEEEGKLYVILNSHKYPIS